jgi:GDPmannose 4,6-dehydratase
VVLRINPKFYRPAEVDLLVGNPTKAREVLGWIPNVTFEKLVTRMMAEDNKTHTG